MDIVPSMDIYMDIYGYSSMRVYVTTLRRGIRALGALLLIDRCVVQRAQIRQAASVQNKHLKIHYRLAECQDS